MLGVQRRLAGGAVVGVDLAGPVGIEGEQRVSLRAAIEASDLCPQLQVGYQLAVVMAQAGNLFDAQNPPPPLPPPAAE